MPGKKNHCIIFNVYEKSINETIVYKNCMVCFLSLDRGDLPW